MIENLRLDNITLQNEFKRKCFANAKGMKGNDAERIIPRTSEVFQKLIDGIYIYGTYPWETDDVEPRLLFSSSRRKEQAEVFIPFCFPNKREVIYRSYSTIASILSEIYSEKEPTNSSFYPLYFIEKSDSPYLFCMKFLVCSMTLPTLSHHFTFEQLLSKFDPKHVPFTEICIAIHTKFSYEEYARLLIKWIIECDRIALLEVSGLIESYLENGQQLNANQNNSSNLSWPLSHRRKLKHILKASINQFPPDPNEKVIIDQAPYPMFSWTRPISSHCCFSLARTCLYELVKLLSPKTFVRLFSALCLEKSIVLYHKDGTIVSRIIIALHYLIRPLKWVSTSISILPPSLIDLLDAPNPVIIGVTTNMVNVITNGFIYVDLSKDKIYYKAPFPEIPNFQNNIKEIDPLWKVKSPDDTNLNILIRTTNLWVKDLLDPIYSSIMSNYTNIKNVQSAFMVELYLSQFQLKDRFFIKHFSETQMFTVFIEQECRKRSDKIRKNYIATAQNSAQKQRTSRRRAQTKFIFI